MSVYGAGSKYLGRTEKEAEWRRFHAPQAPGNSHCAPTVTTISVSRDRAVCQSPPIRPPNALATSGLVDEPGWVSVDRHTLATRFPGVYAVLTRPSSIWISAPGVTSERSAG
jgi:hypothetical protein